ncbi:MAG: S8 family serine peptidase [Phycisphaerales bacterium]|nr:S8 family serine peptidase [Phycisphaerales bacterium]
MFVKFRDDAPVRAEAGRLIGVPEDADSPGGLLLASDGWTAWHDVDAVTMTRLRSRAEAYWGGTLPDPSKEFGLHLPAGVDVETALASLMALEVVAYAAPVALPPDLPTPGNYEGQQGYLNAATGGMNPRSIWTWPGGAGGASAVCDIEYAWNTSHIDLPPVTVLGATPQNPFSDNHHGTAVLGVLMSRPNGFGTTGGVHNAPGFVAGAYTANQYRLNAAILSAAAGLEPGDVILIEQQIWGPNNEYVPSEWVRSVYDAIRIAVGNGIHVVEAAGNGGQNLDDAMFSSGNGGHWPFLAANDSGAIIVGAGGTGSSDRQRLSFSCYGSTVDLQGWGHNVVTTGYGSLYNAEGLNAYYTGGFNGTSSASPTVVNAVASVSSLAQAVLGDVLTPAELRDLLRSTGSPQLGALTNIGPRPDVLGAAWALFGPADCDGNSRPDAVDIALGAPDADGNGVPDICEPCPADLSGSSDPNDPGYGVPDGSIDSADFFYFLDAFAAGDAQTADLTGSSDPNDPAYGTPDGLIDAADFFFYLDLFVQGC